MITIVAKRAALGVLTAVMLAGCTTTRVAFEDRSKDAATLETSMASIHDSTVGVLNTVNTDLMPFRAKAESRGETFDPDKLYVLRPADIAVWDKLLKALDLYCTGLSKLAGNTPATDFTTSAESLASDIQSLGTMEKMTVSSTESNCATAVIALGDLLIRYKANADLHQIVGEATPHFNAVVDGLVAALGFAGTPPKPQGNGILGTYDDTFGAYNIAVDRQFQNGHIAGFADLTPAQREGAIQEYLTWKKAAADHADQDTKIAALASALVKAKEAHAALAGVSPQHLKDAYSQLVTAVKAVQQIHQKL